MVGTAACRILTTLLIGIVAVLPQPAQATVDVG